MSALLFIDCLLFMLVALGLSIALHEIWHFLPSNLSYPLVPQNIIEFGMILPFF